MRTTFPPFEELWSRRVVVEVAGRPVETLSAYDALVHSAGHSSRDHWRWLRGIADVHRLMSAPQTWELADRPLQADQLLTIGLAGRLLGVPQCAPTIVHSAVAVSGPMETEALRNQSGVARLSHRDQAPGANLSRALRATHRAKPATSDYVRTAMRWITPSGQLAKSTSPHVVTGLSEVLWRRAKEVKALVSSRLQQTSQAPSAQRSTPAT